MATGSKPHGLHGRVRVEAQHTDGTGAWLEFGHGTSCAGKQRNDSRGQAVTQHRRRERAAAANAEPVLQSAVTQHWHRERAVAASDEPVLQSAVTHHRHRKRAVATLAQPVVQSAVTQCL